MAQENPAAQNVICSWVKSNLARHRSLKPATHDEEVLTVWWIAIDLQQEEQACGSNTRAEWNTLMEQLVRETNLPRPLVCDGQLGPGNRISMDCIPPPSDTLQRPLPVPCDGQIGPGGNFTMDCIPIVQNPTHH
jgi:hypothetical protein